MEEAHFNIDFSTPEERSGRMRIWVERDIIKEPNQRWDRILSRHLESETMTEKDVSELLLLWHQARADKVSSGNTILRNIIVVPACFIAIGLVYWGLGKIFNWITAFDSFFSILLSIMVFMIVGGAIFMLVAVNFVAFISRISPKPEFAIGTVRILSALYCLYAVISIWTTPVQFTSTMIFCCIVFSAMSIFVAINLVGGAKHVNYQTLKLNKNDARP